MAFRNETAAATTTVTRRNCVRVAVLGGAVAVLPVAGLVTATTASAASVSTWDKVAQCESTGNWSINTGNGLYGGLQFTSSTWAAFGGTQYAAQANQATKDQQIAVAEKVLASQGPGAWPVCSVKAGLTKGGAAPQVDTAARTGASKAAPKSVEQPVEQKRAEHRVDRKADSAAQAPASKGDGAKNSGVKGSGVKGSGATYTVKSGDTLSSIAAEKGLDWKALYSDNSGVVGGDPNLILPGQVLSV
ncbi:transglycosylase family protein [Kitasatospora sp. NPDC056138]|uniref:transglycosylase family protein n=1 Tax=Kitasatospora sp. NPDC056138 TaxID=3345724 RepID=UPI0035E34B6B